MEEAKKCASPRSAARAAAAAPPPPPSLGHPELDDAAAAKDDYPALEKTVEEPPPALTAGERKVHAFLRKLEATKALNATQEAQLAALEAKLAPPPPPPHPPSSWTANARVRAPPAAEPELRDPPPARSVRDAHAPPPRPPSAPLPRRAAWQNAAPAPPSPERTPPATPERAGGESWPGVRDVTPPKSSPKPSPKKRVSFSPHVEEWPGVTEAAPRAMPARDDGMKVVKSRRGHGAVSPETARANARKRRKAQRRDAAGRNVFTGLDDAKEEAPPPPEVRRRKPEAPPPPPKDTSPKHKPPKARRKKAAADDGFVDYAGDLRERVAGVASILAVGFKTAKSCVWDPAAQRYRPTPVYDDASTAALADVWRGAGVRVICLARLNGLAWEISRARKLVINAFYDEVRAKALEVFALLGDGALARDDVIRGVAKNESIAQFRAELRGGTQASTILAGLLDAPDQLKHALPKTVDNATWAAAVSAAATRAATFTVPLDCSRRGLSKIANETLEHVRQFHGECAALGTRTRALWVPYEAIKDGSPRQRKALAAVLDFLNLDRRATITADTTHDSPGATANYVADAERCRATLAPNPYLGAMLDDPYFPYGPKG